MDRSASEMFAHVPWGRPSSLIFAAVRTQSSVDADRRMSTPRPAQRMLLSFDVKTQGFPVRKSIKKFVDSLPQDPHCRNCHPPSSDATSSSLFRSNTR